jgi:hypothetical protein
MDQVFTPLVDVSQIDLKDLIETAPDSELAKAAKRIVEAVSDDNDVISAFQSFVN